MAELDIIIAAPNPVLRIRLGRALATVPGLRVIAEAGTLPETYTAAEAMEPDAVLVAREFTLVPEYDCMRSLFAALDISSFELEDRSSSAPRPVGQAEAVGRLLDPAMPPDHLAQLIRNTVAKRRAGARPSHPQPLPPARPRGDRLVLIGASTGGIDALLSVLSRFPADCPPTAVVQHTGRGFSDSLIRLLNRRCTADVVAARDGLSLRPGMVGVAAGIEGHLRIRGSGPVFCALQPGPPVSGHMPSVDALFHSAVPMASKVVAVLLTGMGRDGADGLLALRRAGATTIAQDEETSVVYGMPRAAWELGAVQQRLPIDRIAAEILRACSAGSEPWQVTT